MRIYVSGKISTLNRDRRKVIFARAADYLRKRGHIVVNPMEFSAGSWQACLRRDIKKLVDCQAIYCLRGHQNSRGARLELRIAKALGLKIIGESECER